MGAALLENINTHVVDILGNVRGRDQPIMLMNKAIELVSVLGEELLLSDDVVFFDPFCKGGEILLAAAFVRNLAKSKHKHLVSVENIQEDMFKGNRYFALAPDERHYRLSLRTFLGNEKSHVDQYTNIIKNGNYLSEVDGRLNEEKFKKEFENMINHVKKHAGSKRIIAIGNPPYQEADGGHGASARLIYPLFVDALITSEEIRSFVLVIPSRWFAGGKNLDTFREKMIESKNIKSITHFGKSGDVFPTVDVDGGVCFMHWDGNYNGRPDFISEGKSTNLNLEKFDIIPDDSESYPILEKIRQKWTGQWVGEVAWSGKPFGLRTFYFERNPEADSNAPDAIPCLSRDRTIRYVDISCIPKNKNFIDYYKVAIPNAYGGQRGDRRITLPPHQFFVIPKGTIATETYNIVHCFKTKKEAEQMVVYLQTNFVRYLLGLRKITQHIPKDRWNWVPLMDFSITWTDEKLCEYFKISKKEYEHIKKKVQEWS